MHPLELLRGALKLQESVEKKTFTDETGFTPTAPGLKQIQRIRCFASTRERNRGQGDWILRFTGRFCGYVFQQPFARYVQVKLA